VYTVGTIHDNDPSSDELTGVDGTSDNGLDTQLTDDSIIESDGIILKNYIKYI
jgi:hypothetical protein